MTAIPFIQQYDFKYGEAEQITPYIRRVTARNPGSYTFQGTGTYIIGHGEVAVIDPGPLLQDHIASLKSALRGEEITHILITHTHLDHSPAAAPLKLAWGAKTYAYGPHGAGKIASGASIEAGGDMNFKPDITVRHGDLLSGPGWNIECVYTPGHASNHICFALKQEKALFTGDHVMGWSTTVIGPPDGSMTAYRDSLDLLLTRDDEIYWPTHGACIGDVKNFVQAYIDHRISREQQILQCIGDGITQITAMVPVMYAETDRRMYAAAAQSVLAAIQRLVARGQINCSDHPPDINSVYGLN